MDSPQRSDSPPESRSGTVIAVVTAAAVAACVEVVFSATGGARHSPAYTASAVGLSLLVALGFGIACAVPRLATHLALAGWVWVAGRLVGGFWEGLLSMLAFASLLWIPRIRASPPVVLGIATGGSWALATLAAPRIVARFGADSWMRPSAVAVLAVLGCVIAWWIWSRIPRRVPLAVSASVLAAVFLAASAKPLLSEHKSGVRRLERELGPTATAPTDPTNPARPNVFVFVLDTVRADHMSLYGYERATTPGLAQLVANRPNARVYGQAYANATWTVPSHATLLSGLLPSEHGADFARAAQTGFRVEAPHMLAESLHAQGWETVGVFANFWLWRVRGMERGFEHYERARHGSVLPLMSEALRANVVPSAFADEVIAGPLATDVNRTLLDALTGDRSRPVFAFVNYADAHGPYVPPPEFRGKFVPWSAFEEPLQLAIDMNAEDLARTRARYDEELLALDHGLCAVIEDLGHRKLLENAWVFVTSDHGEAFGEHGVTEHGTAVYDEIVRVPLIVFPPSGTTLPPDVGPVSLADVAATMGAIVGVDVSGPGLDLRLPRDASAHAIVEFQGDPAKAGRHGELALEPAQAVVRGAFKLIRYEKRGELYDVVRDPLEKHDLAREMPQLVEELTALLPKWVPRAEGTTDWSKILPRDDLEKLRGFGYMGEGEH